MNQRAQAALILNQVTLHHQSLSTAIQDAKLTHESMSLIKEFCFGTLRHYHYLGAIVEKLLLKPLKEKDQDIHALILLGVYQLYYLSTPDYAAVSETVNAAKQLQKNWAAGLINKVLRRAINEREKLMQQANATLIGQYSHPLWLIDALKQAWPEQWDHILQVNNEHPPLYLRINPLKTTRDDFLKILSQHEISAEAESSLPYAIKLAVPKPVNLIPGFNEGLCSVQDASGQYVAELLDLKEGQFVLDACAAPGGKTSHMLELQPKLARLIAIDKDSHRLLRVKENISRLQLNHSNVQLKLADATHTDHWWDGTHFDRILLDAPCSGTGVIRRHPDIKLLRQEADIIELKRQQQKLLTRLWPLLTPGGKLVYSTCSVLPTENEDVIREFIQHHTDAEHIAIKMDWGFGEQYGHQILPQSNGPDGFYYAVLRKKHKN